MSLSSACHGWAATLQVSVPPETAAAPPSRESATVPSRAMKSRTRPDRDAGVLRVRVAEPSCHFRDWRSVLTWPTENALGSSTPSDASALTPPPANVTGSKNASCTVPAGVVTVTNTSSRFFSSSGSPSQMRYSLWYIGVIELVLSCGQGAHRVRHSRPLGGEQLGHLPAQNGNTLENSLAQAGAVFRPSPGLGAMKARVPAGRPELMAESWRYVESERPPSSLSDIVDFPLPPVFEVEAVPVLLRAAPCGDQLQSYLRYLCLHIGQGDGRRRPGGLA